MSNFGKSLSRELGKNTGKVISNVVAGDMWSTPYRRVDKARVAATEAKIERQRKEQIFAIDSAVLKNIDAVAGYKVSNDKTELLYQLAELEIQLKSNKWRETLNSEENQVRNKFCDALFEKYKQALRTLKMIDPNEPQIEHFEKIRKRTNLSKIIRTYPTFLGITIFFIVGGIVLWLDSLGEDERTLTLVLTCVIAIIAISLIIFFKVRAKKRKKELLNQSMQTHIQQTKSQNTEQEYVYSDNSIFIDLNENDRIEIKLTNIWNRYRNAVDKKIISRKPIFSADGVIDSILFVGVNPSYNPNDDNIFVHSSDNKTLMYGSLYQLPDAPEYFKLLERFAEKAGKAYSHINLLYARENDRDSLLTCDHNFIREQLELTYDTIKKINPVAIIFFTDYCKDLIFAHWVTERNSKGASGYMLNGTDIPVFFSDDITTMDENSQFHLIQKIKLFINR